MNRKYDYTITINNIDKSKINTESDLRETFTSLGFAVESAELFSHYGQVTFRKGQQDMQQVFDIARFDLGFKIMPYEENP